MLFQYEEHSFLPTMYELSDYKINSNIGFEKQSTHCDVKQDYEQSCGIRLGSDEGMASLSAKSKSDGRRARRIRRG